MNFHFVDVNIAAIAHEMVSYARRKFAHCWYVSPCPFFSICLLIFFSVLHFIQEDNTGERLIARVAQLHPIEFLIVNPQDCLV